MIPDYVRDIQVSLENKCYYSALSLALALPDICGCAEYPNKGVAERYIMWYDTILGDEEKQQRDNNNPWLSGEMVYNLRNMFLHAGLPNVDSSKIKESDNQVDQFVLFLGDGSVMLNMSINIPPVINNVGFKSIMVDATHLCSDICDAASRYYEKNKEKYSFKIFTVRQEDFISAPQVDENISTEDIIREAVPKLINSKLEAKGSEWRVGNI